MAKPQKKTKKPTTEMKYELYEAAVQDPEDQVKCFDFMYSDINNRLAQKLREDFCGTYSISTNWVKQRSTNSALAIDYDPEPLEQGKERHFSTLSMDQKERLKAIQEDVRNVKDPKSDIIAACNFSFYIFKKRQELVEYFKSSLESLDDDGILALEMVGGPGFIETPMKEQRTVKYEHGEKKGKVWFRYFWDQHEYNPIQRNGLYSISFKLASGERFNNVFEYDWRIWTIPEVREALEDAGFSKSYVYWEIEDDDGDPTGEYEAVEEADNDDTWICYVVGKK